MEGGQESTGVSLALSNGSESSVASVGTDESGGESGTTDQSSGDDFDINEWINENSLRNSLFGAVSVIAGGIEIIAGILLLPETFGASSIIIAHGLDTTVTGLFSVVTGESSRTLTQVIATNAFRGAGFDESSSSIGGLLVDIGLGLVGGLAAAKSAPKLAALFGPKAATSGGTLFSRASSGPRASIELLDSMRQHGRTIKFAGEGSEELRYLNAMGAEANVGGPGHLHILLRENPSKAAALEEFLHGTQSRLGIIDRLGVDGAEAHVRSFMWRHRNLLGL